MSNKKNFKLEEKEQLAKATCSCPFLHYNKSKKEHKDKNI